MRNIVICTFLLISKLVLSQVDTEHAKGIDKYFVYKDCKDLLNNWGNNSCSKRKITTYIFKYFDWEQIENKDLEYNIWFKFYFGEDGLVSNYEIQTDDEIIKSQIIKILDSMLSGFKLIDANSEPISGRFGFPCRVSLTK